MYEGDEDYEPMRKAFGVLNDQIHDLQLQGVTFSDRKLWPHFFFSADLPALQCSMGLSQGGNTSVPFANLP